MGRDGPCGMPAPTSRVQQACKHNSPAVCKTSFIPQPCNHRRTARQRRDSSGVLARLATLATSRRSRACAKSTGRRTLASAKASPTPTRATRGRGLDDGREGGLLFVWGCSPACSVPEIFCKVSITEVGYKCRYCGNPQYLERPFAILKASNWRRRWHSGPTP